MRRRVGTGDHALSRPRLHGTTNAMRIRDASGANGSKPIRSGVDADHTETEGRSGF